MFKFIGLGCVVLGAALLGACGGQSSTTGTAAASTAHGTLAESPPFRIASLSAAAFGAELSANATSAGLLQITGAPICGVDFYYLKFWTQGGAAVPEVTESSGALMVPTGAAPACSGARPIVLFAHGTQTDKTANMADITNPSNTEGVLVAAMFAAQGYIVVAPNYAGYDISTLGYHPFLNAVQQSGEMIDALAAARTALPGIFASATTDSGQLFITGYSQGGYVAIATLRAMQAAGLPVTAAAGLSGPYALEAFGDGLVFGAVDIGATVFAPLLTTSYQKAYGNIYTATTDVYSTTYASGIDTLLPSSTPIDTIFATGLLPEQVVFDSTTPTVTIPGNALLSAELTAALAVPSSTTNPFTPLFDAGFGMPYLLNNSFRLAYALDAAQNPDGAVPTPTAGVPLAAVAPTQTFRLALYKNDLRTAWAPKVPTLLCGGDQDPTVFYSVNTGTMQAFWAGVPTVAVLDVNATPAGPFASAQAGFQQYQAEQLAYYESAAGGSLTPLQAEEQLVANYHANVAPFCAAAARGFFSQF
ncbi:MAG: prolyl oligopeptidase family serine peptidase [Steroidobacteraceae bacterium]|jgi:predicted esterase